MQSCASEVYQMLTTHDIDLEVIHTLGLSLKLADASSCEHLSNIFASIVNNIAEFLLMGRGCFQTMKLEVLYATMFIIYLF